MADIWSKEKRSEVMAAIRSSGNQSTELRMATLFRSSGVRGWRRHQPMHGTPDFLFRKQRLAVFVDGCFWHGCPKCFRPPASRTQYWVSKIESNKRRDRRVARKLRAEGWSVIRVWECDLRANPEGVVVRVRRKLEERT